MDAATREAVRQSSNNRCEYCHLPQHAEPILFHIEHVIAKQHRGGDDSDNLAVACHHCNRQKGPNLASIDPDTNLLVPLFNPRLDDWYEHFKLDETRIVGLTAIGRATVELLQFNAPDRVKLRDEWVLSGGNL